MLNSSEVGLGHATSKPTKISKKYVNVYTQDHQIEFTSTKLDKNQPKPPRN